MDRTPTPGARYTLVYTRTISLSGPYIWPSASGCSAGGSHSQTCTRRFTFTWTPGFIPLPRPLDEAASEG